MLQFHKSSQFLSTTCGSSPFETSHCFLYVYFLTELCFYNKWLQLFTACPWANYLTCKTCGGFVCKLGSDSSLPRRVLWKRDLCAERVRRTVRKIKVALTVVSCEPAWRLTIQSKQCHRTPISHKLTVWLCWSETKIRPLCDPVWMHTKTKIMSEPQKWPNAHLFRQHEWLLLRYPR